MTDFSQDKVLLFRAEGSDTNQISAQTTHKWVYDRARVSQSSMENAVTNPSTVKITLEVNLLSSTDDITNLFREVVINGLSIEIWEVDISKGTDDGLFPVRYAKGHIEHWEEDHTGNFGSIITRIQIDNIPVFGTDTIPEQLKEDLINVYDR